MMSTKLDLHHIVATIGLSPGGETIFLGIVTRAKTHQAILRRLDTLATCPNAVFTILFAELDYIDFSTMVGFRMWYQAQHSVDWYKFNDDVYNDGFLPCPHSTTTTLVPAYDPHAELPSPSWKIKAYRPDRLVCPGNVQTYLATVLCLFLVHLDRFSPTCDVEHPDLPADPDDTMQPFWLDHTLSEDFC